MHCIQSIRVDRFSPESRARGKVGQGARSRVWPASRVTAGVGIGGKVVWLGVGIGGEVTRQVGVRGPGGQEGIKLGEVVSINVRAMATWATSARARRARARKSGKSSSTSHRASRQESVGCHGIER